MSCCSLSVLFDFVVHHFISDVVIFSVLPLFPVCVRLISCFTLSFPVKNQSVFYFLSLSSLLVFTCSELALCSHFLFCFLWICWSASLVLCFLAVPPCPTISDPRRLNTKHASSWSSRSRCLLAVVFFYCTFGLITCVFPLRSCTHFPHGPR